MSIKNFKYSVRATCFEISEQAYCRGGGSAPPLPRKIRHGQEKNTDYIYIVCILLLFG